MDKSIVDTPEHKAFMMLRFEHSVEAITGYFIREGLSPDRVEEVMEEAQARMHHAQAQLEDEYKRDGWEVVLIGCAACAFGVIMLEATADASLAARQNGLILLAAIGGFFCMMYGFLKVALASQNANDRLHFREFSSTSPGSLKSVPPPFENSDRVPNDR